MLSFLTRLSQRPWVIHALFVVGIVAISVAAFIYNDKLDQTRIAFIRLTHAYEVLLGNLRVVNSIRAQNGYCHGYVVVKDTTMLNSYFRATERTWMRFQDLEKNVQDNATQRLNVHNLRTTLVQKQAVMDSIIAEVATGKSVNTDRIRRNNDLTNRVMTRVRNIANEENRLKSRREQTLSQGEERAYDLGKICLGIAVFFFVVKYILTYMQANGIRSINNELEESNRELEGKVEERTHDLQVQIALRNQELARKNRELEEARRFQMSLIPVLDIPDNRWEASAHIWPAEDVGGDYYDFKLNEELDELLLTVGDAAGHGLMAAMIVSNVHSYWHGFADQESSEALMTRISQGLYALKLQMAIMAMAVIRLTPGKLELTSAAMPPFLLYHADSDQIEVVTIRSMFLGSAISGNYVPHNFDFKPGDLLLCCSDGLIEARNQKGEMYGAQRLRDSLNRYLHLPIRQLSQAIYQDMRAFTGERAQQDDVTVLAVRMRA